MGRISFKFDSQIMKVFGMFFAPFLLFITLDFTSTWIGVCMLGGFEMNGMGVTLAGTIGFIPTALVWCFSYAFCMAVLARAFIRSFDLPATPKKWFTRIGVVCIVIIAAFNYINILLMNASSLLQMTGHDVQLVMPVAETVAAAAAQDFAEAGGHTNFCRLV